MQVNQAKEQVLEACRELVARGLVARTWGNISCRINDESFAITPSGIGYERLSPENIVVVDTGSLEHEGEVKPSSEKGIHAAAYRHDKNTRFVIHTHQTYATCISVAGFSSLAATEEEQGVLGGAIDIAKYGLPGTKKLSGHVEEALARGSKAVLMENHGALLTGANPDMAFRRSVALEEVCRRAAPGAPLSGRAEVTSRRLDEGRFSFDDGGGPPRTLSLGAAGLSPAEALHAALYAKYPGFGCVMQLSSPVIDAVMAQTKKIPALLDDFAQMVGGDTKVCPPLLGGAKAAVSAMRGRNCVCVEGLGAVCCEGNEADCAAILTLAEKNALAWLNAAEYGPPKPLSFVDRKLMRLVYTLQYSKKK